ncbi:hypothetical protein K9L05_02225 [Candidatus Babeliales bacterium]|nr:hypothetical protein [Candidatus Babeliales bacterium]
MCVFFVSILIIIIRLFYLQIYQNEELYTLSQKNYLRTQVILPQRGNLVDCNGILLASNRPVFDLYWQGTGKWDLSCLDCLKKIENIFCIDFNKDSKINMIKSASLSSKRFLLKPDITFEELCRISEQCSNYTNLLVKNSFKRVYPYKNMASHVLGYLGQESQDFSKIGLYGLEKIFQEDLKGEAGCILSTINSKGTTIDQKIINNPRPGKNIALTLDFNLQKISQDLFNSDQSGAFLVMNPQNGDIKVLLSYPDFDPNIFLGPVSQQDWIGKLSYNNPLHNRVTNAAYPPASLYKLVTFTAGLEEGIIDSDSKFLCNGYIKFAGRKYHCIRHWGHGRVGVRDAIAYSCNVPCFEIAKEIKINCLASYAYKFGLGDQTGFLLPEKTGLVPTFEWKVGVKGEPWYKGETLSASIGQSFNLVTPLQMARMFTSIFTGYLVKPRILVDSDIEKEDLEISENTLKILKEGTRLTVLQGSAKKLGSLKDFVIHAKTGTAQTASLTRKRDSKNLYEHAWIACYFQYKDDDPLVIIVLVENVGFSEPAREIAYKFLTGYKNLRLEQS